jgi:uncharacterized protein YnzC (UPF0291/DUF896 family)
MSITRTLRKSFLVSGIFLILVTACSVPSQSTPPESEKPGVPTPEIANSKDFSAQNNPDGQVVFSWKPIPGADSYLVELQIGGNEYVPLASVKANRTTFTDDNPPADSSLTYRLSAVTKSKTIGTQLATVDTPAEKPNPIKITVEFDKSPAAIDPNKIDISKIDPNNFDPSKFMPQPVQTQTVVGPKGGSISVTGLSGVVYTLKIPADSLSYETSLTLKPVSSIPDLPLSKGLTGALFIEPQDTVFRVPATLTIASSKSSPVSQGSLKAGFAFNSEGQEFHLFPRERNIQANLGAHLARPINKLSPDETPEDKLKIHYGGGYGVGNATPADVQKVSTSNPTNAVDGTDQQMALAQIEDDLAPITNISDDNLSPLRNLPQETVALAKTGEQIFQQLNKANDWNKFLETVDKLTIYMNSDGSLYNKGLNGKIISALLEKTNKLLKKSKGDCLSQEDLKAQELLERLVNPKDDFSKSFSDQFKAKFTEKFLNDLYNGQKSCTYELQIRSNLTFDAEKSTLSTTMEAQKIPLQFIYVKGEGFLWGSGPMKLSSSVSGACSFPVKQYDGLTLFVEKLSPVFTKGKITDFSVNKLIVHGWADSIGVAVSGEVCPTIVKINGGGDSWTGLFTLARASKNNMMMKGWIIKQGDFAKGTPLKANWESVDNSFKPMGFPAVMSEDTKLELNIKPAKTK